MDITSTFQFAGHKVVKLLVEIPIGYDNEKSSLLNYYASYDTEYQSDKWAGSVIIGFRQCNKEGKKPDVIYEVVVVGRFIYVGSDSEDTKREFIDFLKTSGAATVIPLARSAIASASALCGSPNVCIVPNINVYQLNWTVPGEDISDSTQTNT